MNARKATSDVKPKMPLRGGLDRTESLSGIDEVKIKAPITEYLITAILAAMVAIYFAVCVIFGSVMFR